MKFPIRLVVCCAVVAALSLSVLNSSFADPCGMVPPIYDGPGVPITRVGEQQTYVFYKDGIESFVIRPAFQGKVDEFGMLIPFPSPPALRKVPDHIFPHIGAAIDPPEVVVHLGQQFWGGGLGGGGGLAKYQFNYWAFQGAQRQVKVIKQEAVGMYEVAVLAAGSAKALKRWIDDHGFRYPEGMDEVTQEYVEMGWCFVAVKTKVGQTQGVKPKPGQRQVAPKLPAGSSFDGHVQAMGFRFKTDELVVPMRLSAFNNGELRNIVYLMTDGPQKIRSIPEEYVVRQIPGRQLFKNVTGLLPLRIIGGTQADIPAAQRKLLPLQRNPNSKNGAAKELFAADLLAVATGQLGLPQEEQEKELLRIGEYFGLRGPEIDLTNAQALKQETDKTVARALKDIGKMTLTVVDGDFPREILAKQNLRFSEYRMPGHRNKSQSYDANLKGPAPKKQGLVILGALDPIKPSRDISALQQRTNAWQVLGASLLIGLSLVLVRQRRQRT
jgi:hypothetical protein